MEITIIAYYLVMIAGTIIATLFVTSITWECIKLWFISKVEVDLIDHLNNKDIRRTLDDKLKLLLYRVGRSAGNQTLMDFRNRRIVRVKYSYSLINLPIKGWRDCWDGMIYLHAETENPPHLEIRTVVEVLPDFKEEALKLLIARKVLLGRRHEKMDPQ